MISPALCWWRGQVRKADDYSHNPRRTELPSPGCGPGGVGGYFGGLLAAAGEEVSALARGAHLEAIKRPLDDVFETASVRACDLERIHIVAVQVTAGCGE